MHLIYLVLYPCNCGLLSGKIESDVGDLNFDFVKCNFLFFLLRVFL